MAPLYPFQAPPRSPPSSPFYPPTLKLIASFSLLLSNTYVYMYIYAQTDTACPVHFCDLYVYSFRADHLLDNQ